tara:strand:+ start:598 stop:870 length:273 start_codon:yes stop_codon:yes gene_type:complete
MNKKRIDGFNIRGKKQSLNQPEYCYRCVSDDIAGIEIIGAMEEPLIWECNSCGNHMLKFSEEKTEKLLQRAPEISLTTEEWNSAWQGKPN